MMKHLNFHHCIKALSVMKKNMLTIALEELHEDLTGCDGEFETDRLQEVLIENDLQAQYAFYDKEITDSISMVAALESIYEEILNSDSTTRINYDTIAEITNTLASSSGMPSVIEVATENWNSGSKEKKKQLALESLGGWIKKVWKAIIDFLTRIWNWIKGLFSWQKKKEARLKAEAEEIRKNANEQIKRNNEFYAGLQRRVDKRFKERQDNLNDLTDRIIKELDNDPNVQKYASFRSDKRNSKFNKNIVTPKGEPVSDVIVKREISKGQLAITSESINSDGSSSYLVDNVISILDEIQGLKPCYQSPKSKYLLLSEQYQNSNVYTVQDVQKNLTRFLSTAKGVMKYLEEVQMVYLKKAINVLTASTFDAKQATDVLLHVYPDTSELAKYLPYSKAGDKNVFMDTFPGFEKVEAFCLFNSEALFEAIEAGSGVGKYMDQVKLFKSSISDINDPALIEMSFDETALNAMSDTSYKTFELFQDLSSFSSRYEQVSKGLTKAAERAAKNADDNENKQASAFARMVMHATNVQVNQYLTLLNSIVPEVIEASCDYVRCSMICTNPETAVSLL